MNGIDIAGATRSSFTLSAAQFSDAGLYTLVVSNSAGVAISPAAVLNVGATLSQQLIGNSLHLAWPAPFVLQSALNSAGPYSDVPAATSPYSDNTAANQHKFFRLRSPPISFTSQYLPGGEFSLSGPGVPGYSFVFQASTDQVHWVNLQTNLSPVAFLDTDAVQYPNRIYRAVIAL